MEWQSDKNEYVIFIEKSENVIEKILEVVSDAKISAGSVLWAVGKLENLEIGLYNGRDYDRKTYGGPLEVVSLHGSIAADEPKLHLHVSVAQDDYSVLGGHLFSGIANPLIEMHIRKFDSISLGRKYNEESNLKELTIS